MKMIIKVIDRFICKVEEGVIAFGIILLTIFVFFGVCARTLNFSWTGTEEVSMFLIIWVTFMATSWASREGRHITMSAFLDLAPERIRIIMLTVIGFITGLFCFGIAIVGCHFIYLALKVSHVTPALRVPLWPVYISLPIGLFLTGIQYIRIAFKTLSDQKSESRKDG
jgi:TRAP-type C4-dicarboxylate transport system permease small subunit